MPSKDAAAQKRGTKRKLAAELRSSPAQEAGVDTDVSTGGFTMQVCSCCLAGGPDWGVVDVRMYYEVWDVCMHAHGDGQAAHWAQDDTSTVPLLMQVKVLIQSIRAACERPVDKIERQLLRKQAHQLADYCKDGE